MTMPTLEEQIKELLAAGWKRVRWNIWKSPAGNLFLGPHGAWRAMKGIDENAELYSKTMV